MTNYFNQVLKELDPCGVKENPETRCKYVAACSDIGNLFGKFICVLKMAHQVAYNLNYDRNTGKKIRDLIASGVGFRVVDPESEQWELGVLASDQVQDVTSKIMQKGLYYHKVASSMGDPEDLSKLCGAERILN